MIHDRSDADVHRFFVEKEYEGVRLDVYLTERVDGLSRSYLKRLLEDGQALLNGRTAKAGAKLKTGDAVELSVPEAVELSLEPEDIPLDIVYEDEDLAVINKPCGMVVHPAAGNLTGTLVNALLHHMDHLSGINGVIRPGIVHRLDKETSGLLVVAKNDRAHRFLAEQLKGHTLGRTYLAVVYGNFREDGGTVNEPIGRHPVHRKRMAVVEGGKQAVTHYRVLERYQTAALIECRLETGRTHQIRVHMAKLGHPVVGDELYGPAKGSLGIAEGQALHAWRIRFVHPRTDETMELEAAPPEAFQELVEKLRKKSGYPV
ncbi:RluA family pseudouridine synthase [Gehongia tenuis]|uniref:RluA family pseudouridine synthase n=1 Tax=Gehongia tenuis TaxID=2763655 RepID=UPI002015F016|nr:RluA family pseudouridine synthase [Gehongia tenuis]